MKTYVVYVRDVQEFEVEAKDYEDAVDKVETGLSDHTLIFDPHTGYEITAEPKEWTG